MNPFPMTPIIDVEGKTIAMIDDVGNEWLVSGSIKDDDVFNYVSDVESEKMTSWNGPQKIMVSIGSGEFSHTFAHGGRPSSLDMAMPDAGPGDAPCPHCDRARHEAPLTESMWKMFTTRGFDPYYLSAEDRSPVLCGGSSFIGPMPDEEFWQEKTHPPMSMSKGELIIPANASLSINFTTWLGPGTNSFAKILGPPDSFSLYDEAWNLIGSSKCLEQPAPDVDVTFGPQNWWCEFTRLPDFSPKWLKNAQFVASQWAIDVLAQTVGVTPPDHALQHAVEKVWHTAASQVTIPMTPPKTDWQKMFPPENKYPTTKGFTS